MYTFPELLKEIRAQAGITQPDFADMLGVSAVLIAMIETGQKEVSKNFILKLAELLDVHPSSITPFLFLNDDENFKKHSKVERLFVQWGEEMQKMLIQNRAKKLKREYARS